MQLAKAACGQHFKVFIKFDGIIQLAVHVKFQSDYARLPKFVLLINIS